MADWRRESGDFGYLSGAACCVERGVRVPINFYLLTPSGSFCGAPTSLIVIHPLVTLLSELLAQRARLYRTAR